MVAKLEIVYYISLAHGDLQSQEIIRTGAPNLKTSSGWRLFWLLGNLGLYDAFSIPPQISGTGKITDTSANCRASASK